MAAGQKNAAAVNHHFGNLDQLIRAVLERRADELTTAAGDAEVYQLTGEALDAETISLIVAELAAAERRHSASARR